jgi:hypothetical protein
MALASHSTSTGDIIPQFADRILTPANRILTPADLCGGKELVSCTASVLHRKVRRGDMAAAE